MKRLTFFSLFLLFLSSCTEKDSSSDIFQNVPLIINVDSVKSDSLRLSGLRYIPLETSNECLIGHAYKVLIRDNKIFVADFHQSMAIFIFDMTGKYLSKISKRGQGPGEYISFNDFDIQTNGEIYIHDNSGRKFLIYNQEGEYMREIAVDFYFLGFCLIDDKIYCSKAYARGKTFANLAIYNIAYKKTDFMFKDEKLLYDIDINFNSFDFYYSPGGINYYSPKFSEIIYSIGKDGVRPAIGVKNLNKPPKDVIDGWLQMDIFERHKIIDKSNYFMENVCIYENEKYIIFKRIQTPDPQTIKRIQDVGHKIFIYDKFSKETCYVSEDILFDILGTMKIEGCAGKEFFSVIAIIPDNYSHKKILASRKELKNWKEDDNPVIVLFEPDM
jgi:hypothetical protein